MFIMAVPVDVWAICVLPVKFVHRFCLNTENNDMETGLLEKRPR